MQQVADNAQPRLVGVELAHQPGLFAEPDQSRAIGDDSRIELRLRAQRGSLHEQRIGGAGAVDSGEVVQFRCVSVRAARAGTG